ncbi:hypothetical protein Q0M94_12030 [Deinococcus radiomollis]|uniref:hypothetical protein n=1 Tax=Deinococcus radiomollis TaxID=468916 RepID=UPI00389205DC
MNRKQATLLTAAAALIGASAATGTPYDVFSKGTVMGEHWRRTLVVSPLPDPAPRKPGRKLTRRARKAAKP